MELVWSGVGVVGCIGCCKGAREVFEDRGKAIVFVKAAEGARRQLSGD